MSVAAMVREEFAKKKKAFIARVYAKRKEEGLPQTYSGFMMALSDVEDDMRWEKR